jgi:hypothetical protein
MVMEPRQEIRQIEQLEVKEFQTERFQINFVQIASGGKSSPLTLAIHQNDKNLQGIQIFWSFENQYPSHKDSDGCGNMQKTNIQSF